MSRRAFTLIEVLVSLAIFALAAVSLGTAYSNVLLSRQSLRIDEQDLEDRARVLGAVLEAPNYDDVTTGGEVNLPGDRTARWKGEIEATPVSDLFRVKVEAEMENEAGDSVEWTEERMLLRPTWSVPGEKAKIIADARVRLERERGYTESGRTTVSSSTAGGPALSGSGGMKGSQFTSKGSNAKRPSTDQAGGKRPPSSGGKSGGSQGGQGGPRGGGGQGGGGQPGGGAPAPRPIQ
ncbi:MAG: type II secretion system protein J [Verrucomicrobiota bacterium]